MWIPVNISRENFFPVVLFGVIESLRDFWLRLKGAPPRIEMALDYVRDHATEGDPESVLAAFDTFGRKKAFLMNVGDRKGAILDNAVKESGALRVLEIGAYCGYSAVRVGRLIAPRGGHLTSIEASEEYAAVARQSVDLAGLSDSVEFLIGTAEAVIPTLEEAFDLVFIDHWKDLYLPDLQRLEKHGLLRPGSVVVADNVGLFDASEYLAHVRDSGLYDSKHYPSKVEYRDYVSDAVEISTWRG